VLPVGKIDVDRSSINVGDESLGEPTARAPHERGPSAPGRGAADDYLRPPVAA
jgi:hypothetical protein